MDKPIDDMINKNINWGLATAKVSSKYQKISHYVLILTCCSYWSIVVQNSTEFHRIVQFCKILWQQLEFWGITEIDEVQLEYFPEIKLWIINLTDID